MGTTLDRIGAESALAAKKKSTSGSLPAAKSLRTPVFQVSSLVADSSVTVLPVRDSYSFKIST